MPRFPASLLASCGRCAVLVFSLSAAIPAIRPAAAATRYVKHDATGANSGASWTDAFTSLQSAITSADPGDEIWVAQGVYRPTTGTDRTVSFLLQEAISLYGGFAGAESTLAQRDWGLHPTVLSGDIGAPDHAPDNSQGIVVFSDTAPATIVLDGFIIEDGYGSDSDMSGVGLTCHSGPHVVRNVVLRNNHALYGGGGMLATGNASVLIENVFFIENSAENRGGGLWSQFGSDDRLVNVVFLRNDAPAGGGWVIHEGNRTATNLAFVGNTSSPGGSAVHSNAPGVAYSTTMYNTIVWENTVPQIGGVPFASITFRRSLVQGSGGSAAWDPLFGLDGGGNIDLDPNFVDPSGGDVHLAFGSPAVDSGYNAAPNLAAIDMDAQARIVNGTVDMGAYEFHCPPDSIVRVNPAAVGLETGASWAQGFRTLRRALADACDGVKEVWVAAGTHTPTVGTDRTATFPLRNGLRVYGGFAGTEASVSERDWAANATVLSGQIGTPGMADNSHHVVTASGIGQAAVLDGCTVAGGFSAGAALAFGGGLLNVGSSLVISNVVFQDNTAPSNGGALANYLFADVIVTNVLFVDNAVGAGSGGAVYNVFSNASFTNVTFALNSATAGAALYNNGSSPTLANSVVWGNTGSPVYNQQASAPVFAHCLVEGSGGSGPGWSGAYGIDGGANLDVDPIFVDAPNGNLRLSLLSPAVDAGDAMAPHLPPTDLDGRPRLIGAGVDMGAYESDALVGVEDGAAPTFCEVFPNPFNPRVTILLRLGRPVDTRVTTYDVRGRVVRELLSEPRAAGVRLLTWDGTDRRGVPVASGVYFVRIEAGAFRESRKVTLLK
jgi:hypothetical protein